MQHKHAALPAKTQNWGLRTVLLVLNLFVGLTAVFGGIALLLGISQMPGEWLRNTPFNSFQVPGMILTAIVGGSALVAVVAIRVRSNWDALASLVAGLILTGWILVQVVMIGLQSGLQPFYLLIGASMIALAAFLFKSEWRS